MSYCRLMADNAHILVVDDQEESCFLAAAALRQHLPGCRVSMAYDGPSGLAAALEQHPDLVVLDADLPGLHGFDVCRQLKAKLQPVLLPVLIVTGVQVESGSRTIGIESGAEGYLTKPYDIREFIAMARSLIRLKRNDDALRAAQQTLETALDARTRELRQLEQRSRRIIESLGEGLAIIAGDRIVFLNPAFADMFGMAASVLTQLRGEALAELVHAADHVRVRAAWHAVLEGCSVPRQIFRIVRGDGGVRWVDMSLHVTTYADAPAMEICALDITDRRLADQAVQRFSHRLLSAREDERHRLSSLLHHECGSFALALGAHLAAAVDEMQAGRFQAAINETTRTRELLDSFVGRLKRLAVDLRPPDLDVLGFSAALANHVAAVREAARIDIHLTHTVADRAISPRLATVLFRVTQEALNNAVRHAGATRIDIRLSAAEHHVELSITDDGCGFDAAVVAPDGGIGLRAMSEMVEAWGGVFALETRPAHGVAIRAYLPWVQGMAAPTLDYAAPTRHIT